MPPAALVLWFLLYLVAAAVYVIGYWLKSADPLRAFTVAFGLVAGFVGELDDE